MASTFEIGVIVGIGTRAEFGSAPMRRPEATSEFVVISPASVIDQAKTSSVGNYITPTSRSTVRKYRDTSKTRKTFTFSPLLMFD